MPLARLAIAALLFGSALEPRGAADTPLDPAVALDRAMSDAEGSLRDGELESAESHYRAALLEGWLLMGSLEAVAGAGAEPAQDIGLNRMLATAWLNTEALDRGAELLRDGPVGEGDASLQYAYGLALGRGNRLSEAEPIFARLLARHGDSAELNV